ncbi:MAG TPA: diheme cytochrome c-553, partial [Chryseolinea sp.]|nr:diheme cytochrome c-553 [Chryseolinea sp.]
DRFKTAIQKGKYKGLEGSRMLLPPMPWQVYKNIKEDDLKAIYVYLKSLPPINNLVPQPILSTPKL